MLRSLSTFFYAWASGQRLVAVLIVYLLFPGFLLPRLQARMQGDPIALLFFRFDTDLIRTMIEGYGKEGRAAYALGETTLDVLYPLIYTTLFCLVLSLLYRNPQRNPAAYAPFALVNLVPIGILVADLLENTCIVYLLEAYPRFSEPVAILCTLFSAGKWALSLVTLSLALYGGFQKVRQRPSLAK